MRQYPNRLLVLTWCITFATIDLSFASSRRDHSTQDGRSILRTGIERFPPHCGWPHTAISLGVYVFLCRPSCAMACPCRRLGGVDEPMLMMHPPLGRCRWCVQTMLYMCRIRSWRMQQPNAAMSGISRGGLRAGVSGEARICSRSLRGTMMHMAARPGRAYGICRCVGR